MDLIVETDLGHDPDDAFALLYLHSAGVNIRAILVAPGDPDQIGMARFLCHMLDLDIPVGASKLDQKKNSSGGVHYSLMDHYKFPRTAKHDGLGHVILKETLAKYPDAELFVIGPCSSTGKFFGENPDAVVKRATMQGGFCPYKLFHPAVENPSFVGKDWCPTFNMNGDRPGALNFINAKIGDRAFVGKNVCHTIIYDKWSLFFQESPKDIASSLFRQGMEMYLERHEQKKFHDPLAAVLHLHPEIGTWIKGKPTKQEGGWTTTPDLEGDRVLVDVERADFWKCIREYW